MPHHFVIDITWDLFPKAAYTTPSPFVRPPHIPHQAACEHIGESEGPIAPFPGTSSFQISRKSNFGTIIQLGLNTLLNAVLSQRSQSDRYNCEKHLGSNMPRHIREHSSSTALILLCPNYQRRCKLCPAL